VIQNDDFEDFDKIEAQKLVFAIYNRMEGYYKEGYTSYYIAKYLNGFYNLENILNYPYVFFKMLQKRITEDKNFPENSGTTACEVLFENNRMWIFNFEDSRRYLLNENSIKQITKDPTLIRFLITKKAISKKTVRNYTMQNVIFLNLDSVLKNAWIEERLNM